MINGIERRLDLSLDIERLVWIFMSTQNCVIQPRASAFKHWQNLTHL